MALGTLPVLLLLATPPSAPVERALTVEHGELRPAVLEAPAGERIVLRVRNLESTLVEVESYALNREKRIRPGETAVLYLGPLAAGDYDLYDDEHAETRAAVLVVR